MTIQALHHRADVDWLATCVTKEGGRGLLFIFDVVHVEKSALAVYVNHHEDPIMTKVKEYLMGQDTSITKPSVVAQHIEQWHNKALHGQWPKLLKY